MEEIAHHTGLRSVTVERSEAEHSATGERSRRRLLPAARRLLAVVVCALAALCTSPTLAHADSTASPGGAGRTTDCAAGELCFWSSPGFQGERVSHELLGLTTEECTPLPQGTEGGSLVNRTGRPVTVYQSEVCDTTGDFSTYPSGSWVPEAPYTVRAFTMWER